MWNLQKQFRFVNRNNIEELKFMIAINCRKYIDNLRNFMKEFYSSLTGGFNGYSSLEMFIEEYSINKKVN